MLNLLRGIRAETGVGVLFISPRYAADHVTVMAGGSVVEFGDVVQVTEQPRNPCTRALIAAVPTLR